MKRLLSAAIAACLAVPVSAGTPCLPYADLVSQLAEKYGEARVAMGINGQANTLLEVYANDATGTWSVVILTASGTACLAAAGDGFQRVASMPGKPA